MPRLAPLVAIVTGAGRGLGRAHAHALAAAGVRVVVNDPGCALDGTGTDASVADQVVAEIRADGGEAIASHDAVGTPSAAESIVGKALDAFGRLDILVNNAGISQPAALDELDPHAFERVLVTHLGGTVWCSQAAFRIMRDAGRGGRIIHTTSGAGLFRGYPASSAYAAAKGAIAALTPVIATEGAPFGITCNAIAPLAHTRMSGTFLTGRPTGNEPESIAPLVVFLASAASSGVSGRIFRMAEGRLGVFAADFAEGLASRAGAWTADEIAERLDEVLSSA